MIFVVDGDVCHLHVWKTIIFYAIARAMLDSVVTMLCLESYKMIAWQLLLFHTRESTSNASLCIDAARIHLIEMRGK